MPHTRHYQKPHSIKQHLRLSCLADAALAEALVTMAGAASAAALAAVAGAVLAEALAALAAVFAALLLFSSSLLLKSKLEHHAADVIIAASLECLLH